MKNIIFMGMYSLLFGIVLTTAQVSADVIKFDNFDYADGSLVPNGGWAAHSPASPTGDFMVLNSQAIVQHGTPADDVNLGFTAVSGDVYYGIDFNVAGSADKSGTDHEYFAHFKQSSTNNFAARLDVVAPTGGGNYTVGIASDESTADTIWGSDLTYGVTYRAVVRYNQDSNIAQLWIDATLASDTSILGEDRADPGDPVDEFALRQSDSEINETVTVDNLVIGSAFVDVVNPVPEPASGIVLMAFATGLFARRRRR